MSLCRSDSQKYSHFAGACANPAGMALSSEDFLLLICIVVDFSKWHLLQILGCILTVHIDLKQIQEHLGRIYFGVTYYFGEFCNESGVRAV